MSETADVRLLIQFDDPDLDPISDPTDKDEMDRLTQSLCSQISQLIEDLDDPGKVERVREADVPSSSKAFGAEFMLGLLAAKVNGKNIKTVMQFLGDRLGNKPLEMEIEAPDGRKLKVKASSREEFTFVMQQAQEFLTQK